MWRLRNTPSERITSGQGFDISSWTFETLEEISRKLMEGYGIKGGVTGGPIPEGRADIYFKRGMSCSVRLQVQNVTIVGHRETCVS